MSPSRSPRAKKRSRDITRGVPKSPREFVPSGRGGVLPDGGLSGVSAASVVEGEVQLAPGWEGLWGEPTPLGADQADDEMAHRFRTVVSLSHRSARSASVPGHALAPTSPAPPEPPTRPPEHIWEAIAIAGFGLAQVENLQLPEVGQTAEEAPNDTYPDSPGWAGRSEAAHQPLDSGGVGAWLRRWSISTD